MVFHQTQMSPGPQTSSDLGIYANESSLSLQMLYNSEILYKANDASMMYITEGVIGI